MDAAIPYTPESGLGSRLRGLPQNAWFAYAAILLLQLGVVVVAWRHIDLSGGDTSVYFLMASKWYGQWQVNIAWSPLYTAYYGSVMYLSQDPYTVTLLHRLLIVCAATLLVLAVLRRMLPATLAWWIAVWWAVLPINFNTLYEVHLFGLLPILAAWLAALAIKGPWGRGLSLGILCAASVLVRNELSVATLLYGSFCLVGEWRALRATGFRGYAWTSRPAAYAVPLLVAASLCGFFYWRSCIKYPELRAWLLKKHTRNMSQVFTSGYQQRNPGSSSSLWDEFQGVMKHHFGQEDDLTLGQMIARNPRAVLEHCLWNLSLTPNGLQVLLFNATSGTRNPDYVPVHSGSRKALALSVLVAGVWLAGSIRLVRERQYWWRHWLRPRASGWCAMLAVAAVAVPIILTQRPRPSYLFSVSVFLMTGTGLCLYILLSPLARFSLPRLSIWQACLPVTMIGACLAIPTAWVVMTRHAAPAKQVLRDAVARMRPFAAVLGQPETRFLGEHAFQVMAYAGKRTEMWTYADVARDYRLFGRWQKGTPLDAFLEQQDITLAQFDEQLLSQFEKERADDALHFVTDSQVGDWHLLACQNTPGSRWRLYQHRPQSYAGQRDMD